jgi:TIR domain
MAVDDSNLQAFISYSRADLRYVENLAREFRCAGITTWVDVENLRPGDHWEPAIRGAIRSSRAFVFCISPLSVASGNTFTELNAALSLGLIIFPLMLEPTPIDSLPDALRQRQIVQLFRDPPSIACKRAAVQLARLLGLPSPGNNVFVGDHDSIDALIIRVGACDRELAPEDFLPGESSDKLVVVDRTATPLGSANFATIVEWLHRCAAAYIVVGDTPADDEIGAVSGVAFAILGGKRLSFVCSGASLPTASKLAHLFQARLIECCPQNDRVGALRNSLGAS